ncbi:flagellar biosynthetic protein FliR [Bacillus sp. 03113]|uniref:flagellar biosynthetic protein FliR n=1 Tax=Bacillus sp. 03113 TaxID=2578211 RepID=UPI0011450EBD|nr:flagellar biosynthetic protein FliR [Bacillus sp. 03113]
MINYIDKFPIFLLIFVRVTAFFLMMPIFSYRTIPNSQKIGLGFFLAWILFFSNDAQNVEIDGFYFLLILKEAFVGIFLGFIAYLILSAIQIAGGFIDFQMGFTIANVIDPQTGSQSPLMGQFLNTIALFFLLTVNGHHLLIDGIMSSYHFIPVDQPWIHLGNEGFVVSVMKAFNLMFLIAFQMAIPVVGSLFLVDVALGIVARTVPQINVFVIGLPLKIGVSFAILIAIISVMITVITKLFETMLKIMHDMMLLLGGS